MDMLKKFFPYAFKVGAKDVTALVVSIIIHVVASLIVGAVLLVIGNLLGGIPVVCDIVGAVCGIVGGVVGLYCLIGVVLAILLFLDVLK